MFSSLRVRSAVFLTPYHLRIAIVLLSSIISVYALQTPNPLLCGVIFCPLVLIGTMMLTRYHIRTQEKVCALIVALGFSLSLVLGLHISISGSLYIGSIEENLITPYSMFDLVLFITLIPSWRVVALNIIKGVQPYSLRYGIRYHTSREHTLTSHDHTLTSHAAFDWTSQPRIRFVLIGAGLMFILWLPYLLNYYPGVIFNDTTSSIRQILGTQEWSNHFPVIYTVYLGIWFAVAHIIGASNTTAAALYSVSQMILYALMWSYALNWAAMRLMMLWKYYRTRQLLGKATGISQRRRYRPTKRSHPHMQQRAQCKRTRSFFHGMNRSLPEGPHMLALVFCILWALDPYIATYSIAFWKDPLFSSALLVMTCQLIDAFLSGGAALSAQRAWRPLWVICLLFVLFFRNNGVYLIAAIGLTWSLWHLITRLRDNTNHRPTIQATRFIGLSTLIGVVSFFLITGPFYQAIGIAKTEKAESLGMFVNQMARVVAEGEEISDSDQAFLESMLPYELYVSEYVPTCIDNIKWNNSFNDSALEDKEFWHHWASLATAYPTTFFEAWELETFGFWTVNVPEVYAFANLSGGAPYTVASNISEQLSVYDIYPKNLLSDTPFSQVELPLDAPSVPLGIYLWLLITLSVGLICTRRTSWCIMLIASLTLLGSLVLISPIWYWPRYGAAVQFSTICFVVLVIASRMSDTTIPLASCENTTRFIP